MPRKLIKSGPIGNGWIEERRSEKGGVRFVAYWQQFVPDDSAPLGRRKEYGGSYDLGPKVKHGDGLTSLSAAKKKWLKICDSIMGRRGQVEHYSEWGRMTLRSFAENVYMAQRKPRWKGTTKETNSYYFDKIFAVFGETVVADMQDAPMQEFLNNLAAKGCCESIVKHCRTYLMSVLKYATEEGDVFHRSPARHLQLPDGIRSVNRPYLPLTSFEALVGATQNPRDKLMMKILYMGGLRRGELFALRWFDFDGKSLDIQRQINRDNEEVPAKTKGAVSLPEDICMDLDDWRQSLGSRATPDGFIFPARTGSHLDVKNWINRNLKPVGEKLGLKLTGYHMFRRGLATEMHQNGSVDKNIQAQLRHSDPATTRNVYMRGVPEERRNAVESLWKKSSGARAS